MNESVFKHKIYDDSSVLYMTLCVIYFYFQDSDRDGILNEFDDDDDNDGIPDSEDPDANGDGIPDCIVKVRMNM